jgi:orotidine-5'-phosphate decarboxylase
MTDDVKLLHMDTGSRNQRLYEELAKTGLYVVPVFAESDPTRIDYLQVSASLPLSVEQAAQKAASSGVSAPVARSEVSERVSTADGRPNNVVHLPPAVRQLAVVVTRDNPTIAVNGPSGHPKDGGGLAED